eukprot:4597264-Prymnesium_polylepis.2
MGHWWECIGYGTPRSHERRPLPADCMAAAVQAGPGLYGYYPLIDRSGGGGAAGPERRRYYLQVALQERQSPSDLTGIPEYFRLLVKPVVDVILHGADPAAYPRQALLEQGGGLLQRDLDDIQSALLGCRCVRDLGRLGEPYAALAANLSADVPRLTRRELTEKRGEGLLLSDLVQTRRKLGECACKGRPLKADVEAQ